MQVNIPSVGVVNFPDTMGEDEISHAIRTKILPQQREAALAGAAAKDLPVSGFGGQVGQALGLPAWQQLASPVTKALGAPAPGEVRGLGGQAMEALGSTLGEFEKPLPGVEGMKPSSTKALLEMLTPMNVGIGMAAPELLAARTGLGGAANVAARTYFADQAIKMGVEAQQKEKDLAAQVRLPSVSQRVLDEMGVNPDRLLGTGQTVSPTYTKPTATAEQQGLADYLATQKALAVAGAFGSIIPMAPEAEPRIDPADVTAKQQLLLGRPATTYVAPPPGMGSPIPTGGMFPPQEVQAIASDVDRIKKANDALLAQQIAEREATRKRTYTPSAAAETINAPPLVSATGTPVGGMVLPRQLVVQPVVATRPPVDVGAGLVGFGAPAEAAAVPSARQAATQRLAGLPPEVVPPPQKMFSGVPIDPEAVKKAAAATALSSRGPAVPEVVTQTPAKSTAKSPTAALVMPMLPENMTAAQHTAVHDVNQLFAPVQTEVVKGMNSKEMSAADGRKFLNRMQEVQFNLRTLDMTPEAATAELANINKQVAEVRKGTPYETVIQTTQQPRVEDVAGTVKGQEGQVLAAAGENQKEVPANAQGSAGGPRQGDLSGNERRVASATGLRPAVIDAQGNVHVGGITHDEVIKNNNIPDGDKVFVKPDGTVVSREQAARENPQIATTKEPGKMHSEDLINYVMPGGTKVWEPVKQEISSAKTSLSQIPAAFNKIKFKPNTLNADIGGGAYNLGTELLKKKGVENVVYDPYNRSPEHNAAAMEKIRGGKADTSTVNNVLNVIKEPEARKTVIQQAFDAVKPEGTAYFQIYEGDATGAGKTTTKGWQNNKKTIDYINEIKSVFGNAKSKGNIIEATKGVGGTQQMFAGLPITKEQLGDAARKIAEFTAVPADVVKKLGFKEDAKIAPEQMAARLKNLLGEKSSTWEYLNQSGLKEFLAEPRSVNELKQWSQGVGSEAVKVHTYGMEGKVSEARKEYDKMTHEWYDNLGRDKSNIAPQYWSNLSKENQVKAEQYYKLKQQVNAEPRDTSPKATQSYETVSALPPNEPMPDWTTTKGGKNVQRVDVVIPQDKKYPFSSREELQKNKTLWEQDNIHENLPNTFGWAMIQYKTGPKGERIAVIPELQAQWAQEKRKYWDTYKEAKKRILDGLQKQGEQMDNRLVKIYSDPVKMEAYADRQAHEEAARAVQQYRPGMDHALADNPYRLILKAAIEQARKEGATHIMVSDAETAMMTEGHDAHAEPDPTTYEGYIAPKDAKMVVPQEPGMRLNYDTILPQIAEELTGSKGEKVSLGEHKNAYDKQTAETPDERANGITRQATSTPRSNLIFRNADGTPKTDITGRLYEITPKQKYPFSLTGKDKGVMQLYSGLPLDLSVFKDIASIGKSLYGTVMDKDRLNTIAASLKSYSFPAAEARSPQVANKMAEFANSRDAASFRALANINTVFGDKVKDEQFLKQFGGLVYEDMRQAAGGVGTPVLALKNSPFANAAQYNAAKANPEMQAAIQRWKTEIQAPAEAMHTKLGGKLAATGATTDAFANLIPVLEVPEPAYGPGSGGTGPLAAMKRGSSFSKERKFSGNEYNLNAADMAFRMITKNWAESKKVELYETLESTGMGKLIRSGKEVPDGMVMIKNPVQLRTLVGKDAAGNPTTYTDSKFLAVKPEIASEIKQALQLNTSWSEWLKENTPVIDKLSQVVIKTQTAVGIDLGVHTLNDFMAAITSPKDLAKSDALSRLYNTSKDAIKAQADIVSQNPKIIEELARAAEAGVSFRTAQHGWSSHILSIADTTTRLLLNREFEQMAAAGKIENTPAERRRYVTGRAGEYNKRFMTWFQQGMQETGLGAFNVAGRNFNKLAVKNAFMSPGVKAKNINENLRIRLSLAVGLGTAALVLPSALNTVTTGSPTADGKVEPWQIYTGMGENGRAKVIDTLKMTGLARAGRVTGLGSVMEQQVLPRLRGEQPAAVGQTIKEGVIEAAKTAAQPYLGPPVNMLSTLLTGKSAAQFEQRAPGEQWPYVGAATGAANPMVGPLTGYGTEGAKAVTPIGKGVLPDFAAEGLGRVVNKLGSLAGVKDLPSPRATVTNLRRQFLYKIGKSKDADFAPSEYKPLILALEGTDTDLQKAEYAKLLEVKKQSHISEPNPAAQEAEAKKDLQTYFSKYEKGHAGMASKQDEDAFVKTLTPHQKKLYDAAIEQQQKVASEFFSTLQGKTATKKRNSMFDFKSQFKF